MATNEIFGAIDRSEESEGEERDSKFLAQSKIMERIFIHKDGVLTPQAAVADKQFVEAQETSQAMDERIETPRKLTAEDMNYTAIT